MRNFQAKTYLSLNIEFRSSTFLKKNHLGYVLSLPPNSFFAKNVQLLRPLSLALCALGCVKGQSTTPKTLHLFSSAKHVHTSIFPP